MTILLCASLALLLWPWTAYPLVMWLAARARERPARLAPHLPPPAVTVIVPARDEAATLPEKLASLAAGGVPSERLEVIVVDDGSRDGTADVAAAASARVVRLDAPRGKAAALNAGLAAATHPIVVLTDARQPLRPGALRALLAPFDDPRVGAVSGELDGAAVGPGATYRRFDDALRRLESRSGSVVGVTGALWAARRALLVPLPEGLILDDVFLPMAIARAGRRVVAEPTARAEERAWAAAPAAERRRRVRTLAGNLQLCAAAPWLLAPLANPLWFRFASHKLARLAGPFALAGAVVALAAAAPAGGPTGLLAIPALGAFGLAAVGPRAGTPGALARAFLAAQAQCLAAWRHALGGRSRRLWRPMPDAAPNAAVVSHGSP